VRCKKCGEKLPDTHSGPCPYCGWQCRDIQEHLGVKVRLTAGIAAQSKHSFSRQHFRAADFFAKRSQEFEDQGREGPSDEHVTSVHRSYVTGAIILCVAGLESSVNEFYLEACDKNERKLQGLTSDDIHVLATWWQEMEKRSLLTKYQTALKLTAKQTFDLGSNPYQDVGNLCFLRNALVHYKPEWDGELDAHKKLQDRVQSRFPPNPLAARGSLWFPHLCLGAGCARWAVSAGQAFLGEFCRRMGIPPRV